MKKILVLTVLILALTASMAMAAIPNPWTTYLYAPKEGYVKGFSPIAEAEYYAVTLTATVTGAPSLWTYTYDLTNDAGASGKVNYWKDLYEFNVTLPAAVPFASITQNVTPGWTGTLDLGGNGLIKWTTTSLPITATAGPNHTVQFSYTSTWGPAQVTDAAGIDGRAFNGQTLAPVPEASTLVGFGSALVMAGPGMIGWLRRRRA